MSAPPSRVPAEYDAIVIGAGQAGVPLSRALAQDGRRTALIEREHVGGTCINEGCTPTKTMIASARVAYLAGRAADYGIQIEGLSVDMDAVRRRKREIVDSWRSANERRLEETENLDLIRGEASFLNSREVEVRMPDAQTVRVKAPLIFINTGCRPRMPDLPGLATVPYLTSTTVMELGVLPEHLVILGGGYVAVEFAQLFRRLGSAVTIVQRRGSLLAHEDDDVSRAVYEVLREDGVEILLKADARRVRTEDGGVLLLVDHPSGQTTLSGSHLLVAAGRSPNSEALRPERAELEVDSGGYLPVDDRLQTRVPGIYALGDVKGGPGLTHVSYDDFRIIRSNLLEGGDRSISERLIPYVVFLDPQLGRVGLTERQAAEQGMRTKIYQMQANSVARALETDETRGLLKVVVDADTDRIVGCAILMVDGGEIMALLEVAILGGLSPTTLRETMFAHPTLAEGLNNLFST